MDECIKKIWYTHTHTHTHRVKYYSAIKKEWNNVICRNMDGPRNCHTKGNKSDRERQILYDITYMWNVKYDTNELIYERKTGSHT